MNISGKIERREQKKIWIFLAYGIIFFFVLVSFLAPLISNVDPIYVNDGQRTYWPVVNSTNWQKICQDKNCIKKYTIIPFSPETIDVSSIHASPGTKSKEFDQAPHLLGTDEIGRDVMSALIHGSRTAVWISFLAVLVAFMVGLLYGLCMGYYGSDKFSMTIGQRIGLFFTCALFIYVGYFLFNLNQSGMVSSIVAIFLLLLILVAYVFVSRLILRLTASIGKASPVDVDAVGMRVVDMVKSLPPLFIVLFALQIIGQANIWSLVLLIAYLLWATFARHSRAEVIRLRNKPSVQSAMLAGRSDLWIWRYEFLPFIVRPLFVTFAFSIAAAVLLEATLSFLGLGLPVDHVSWGTLINSARISGQSWWLLVFPGMCMLSLIWSLQHIGRHWESILRFNRSIKSASN